MSRHNSTNPFQGFSISQPALGAALQFYPALGTAELDILIDAYVPGPASVKEKRAHVSMEYFKHAEQTGEFIKFFPVFIPDAFTADSPASSFYDSGYGSGFLASPVVPELSWAQPTQFASSSQASPSSSQSRRPSGERKSPVAKGTTHDFSHIPGMKILTKDGVDVTNSASRGCKTKEQRDHAHLMRIIKACDACKRKKIRCDPSHKKRSASQASSPEAKPAKKTKKAAPPPTPPTPQQISPSDSSDLFAGVSPLDLDASMASTTQFFGTAEADWEQFIHYDAPAAIPDYDFFVDPASYHTPPSSGPSASSSEAFTPPMDASGGAQFQQPTLPYLNDGAHGSNYLDFSLYDGQQQFSTIEPTSDPGWSPPGGEDLGSGVWCQHGPSSSPAAGLQTQQLSASSARGFDRSLDTSQASLTALNTGLGQVSAHHTMLGRVRTNAPGGTEMMARELASSNSQSSSDGSALSSPTSSADCFSRQCTASASPSPACSPDCSSHVSPAPSPTAPLATGLQTTRHVLWGDGRDRLDREESATADYSQHAHAAGDGRDRLDRTVSETTTWTSTNTKRTTSGLLTNKPVSTTAVAASSLSDQSSAASSSLAPTGVEKSPSEQLRNPTALNNRQPSSTGSRRENQEYWATNAPIAAMATNQLQQQGAASWSSGLAVEPRVGQSRAEDPSAAVGVLLAAVLLLTLPFRHSVEGTMQTRMSPPLFVGLGLASVISCIILHASSSDLFQKLAIFPLSLVLVLQHLTSRPSDSVPLKAAPFKDAIGNVKSKIQNMSRMFSIV